MIKIIWDALVIIVLIATLNEYRTLKRKNEEISVLLENTISTKKAADMKSQKLIEDVVYLTKASKDIIKKYDIREYELNKARTLLYKSKKYRVRKKSAKRIIKGE